MPELSIRPVDSDVDADLDGYQEVYAAAELAEDATTRLNTPADLRAMLAPHAAWFADGLTARLDGSAVGAALLTGSLRDNLDQAQLQLWVAPSRRRLGVGSRLLAAAQERATSRGRRTLLTQVRVGGKLDANRRFAERRGYAVALTEVERRRTLPVEAALLDRLAAEAAPHHVGYEIRTSVGGVPASLRASYVELDNLLQIEMPHGDLDVEAGASSVADLVAFEREQEAVGRTRVSAFAVRDGIVAAFTDGSVPGSETRHVDQFGTLVHPAHRGHRLGMAVKCAQLRVLGETFPDRRYVATTNAETNVHMVAINESLGFEIHQVWQELEKRLDSPAPEMS